MINIVCETISNSISEGPIEGHVVSCGLPRCFNHDERNIDSNLEKFIRRSKAARQDYNKNGEKSLNSKKTSETQVLFFFCHCGRNGILEAHGAIF